MRKIITQTCESPHQGQSGFPKANIDGEGDPLDITDGVWYHRTPSSVVRFLQTQKFFRSKHVDPTACYFFRGFLFTILVVRLISREPVDDFHGIFYKFDDALQSIDIDRTDRSHHT